MTLMLTSGRPPSGARPMRNDVNAWQYPRRTRA